MKVIAKTALDLYLNQASFEALLQLTASVQGHHSRRLRVCVLTFQGGH